MVSALLASQPVHLGEGIWLARAQAAQTGWVLATPSTPLNVGELPVSALLLLCAADSGHLPQLENLAKLAAAGQLATFLAATVWPCCRRVRRAGCPRPSPSSTPRSACPSGRHAGQGGQGV
jgi:hypothetical protein